MFGSKPSGLFGSNTTPAVTQAGGLFGSNTTANQGGLFGSQSNNNQQSNNSGGLFGAKPDSQGQQGGGLFGTQPNQQQGGSLFGQQSGALFGNPQQAQQGGSLFSNTQQPQGQQGGSLFGNTQQPQQSGGLFSNTQQQQQQQQVQPQQAASLFGSSFAPQPARGNSLFDSLSQPSQPQQTSNLFGAGQQQLSQMGNTQSAPNLQSSKSFTNLQSSTQQPRPLFASSIGQYSREQQATIPGVRIDLSNLRPTTRFNDLYEDIQRVIEHVDNFIINQIHLHDECEQAMPKVAQALSYIPSDVEYCARQLELVQQALENDAAAIDHTKSLVRTDADNAKMSFQAIKNLRMPQQFHNHQIWNTTMPQQTAGLTHTNSDLEEGSSTNLVSYFSKQADSMSKTLETYKRNIAEVEAYLKGIESTTVQQLQRVQFTKGTDGGERSADDQVRELTAVLKEFEEGIVGVAGKVTEVREKVQERILGEGDNNGRRRGLY